MGITEQEAIKELQTRDEIFVAYSQATKLPYVICDRRALMIVCGYLPQKKRLKHLARRN
ncbi:MAG: hypothetical protein ACLTZM_00700 [Ruminococcus sp.]